MAAIAANGVPWGSDWADDLFWVLTKKTLLLKHKSSTHKMVHRTLTLLLLFGSASSWGGSDSKAPKLLTKDGRARSFTITKTDTTSQGVSLVRLSLSP
jgi:hypothetical protein